MYKIMLSCFVIGSCFVFFANGEGSEIQAPQTETECDKFTTCVECLDSSAANCTFCTLSDNNGTCTNVSFCMDHGGRAVHNKTQCSSTTSPTTNPTPTADTSPVTSPVTVKTESTVTEASSSDASESTAAPSKPSPAPSGRHFDPPSFIGGTVLSLGLLAIVYVGFKFYKARTERNYHTL